jgi:hypothetical protein
LRVLDVLSRRRAALEQQREDIDAVLLEVTSFETLCNDLLAAAGKVQETNFS